MTLEEFNGSMDKGQILIQGMTVAEATAELNRLQAQVVSMREALEKVRAIAYGDESPQMAKIVKLLDVSLAERAKETKDASQTRG